MLHSYQSAQRRFPARSMTDGLSNKLCFRMFCSWATLAASFASAQNQHITVDSVAVHTNFQEMHRFQLKRPGPGPRWHRRMPVPPPQTVDDFGHTVAMPTSDSDDLNEAPIEDDAASFTLAPSAITPPPNASFPGMVDDDTLIPPDTNGAVGPRHVVELLNIGFEVYDRRGVLLAPKVDLQSFWSALGTAPGFPASFPFDPRVTFDQYTGRWLAVSAGNPNGADTTSNAWLLVGASTTDDPTGPWNMFAVRANLDSIHLTDWPDFPTLGVDPNNVIVTANMFRLGASPSFVHADVWVFNKARLLAGGALLIAGTDFVRLHNPGNEFGFTMQPCHTYDQTSADAENYLVYDGWVDLATRAHRFLRFQRITGVGASALVSNFGGNNWVEVLCYNFCKASAPQKDCLEPVDVGSTGIGNAVLRGGRIWTTHSVGTTCFAQTSPCGTVPFTKPEIAWYEIAPSAISAFPGHTPSQQGRISDPNLFAYFPSIAVNARNCVGIGYSASSPINYVGGWFAHRRSNDSAGTMRQPVNFAPGFGPYLKLRGRDRNRWGDYSATIVDPTDDLTIWSLQEFAAPQAGFPVPAECDLDKGQWATRWAAWTCPPATGDCDGNAIVDLLDISLAPDCMNGPAGTSLTGGCGCLDLDGDFDFDLLDFARLSNLIGN